MNPFQHLLLSAYQQHQQQAFLPHPMVNGAGQLPVEYIKKLLEIKNGEKAAELLRKEAETEQLEQQSSSTSPKVSPGGTTTNNNNNVVKDEEEIKREEAMVEDEMKESEEEVDDTEDSEKQAKDGMSINALQLNFLKNNFQKLFENKSKENEEMVNNNCYEESLVSDSNDQDFNGLNQDERKVRVRTLISDEQLSILKQHYSKNPRPKREELERISDQIGHPFKVVKVWFQNSRARDRREGKPVHNTTNSGVMPFFLNGGANDVMGNNPLMATATGLFPRLPLLGPLMNGAGPQHHEDKSPSRSSEAKSPYSTASDEMVLAPKPASNTGDQPLDLSNKGSSPSVSPLSTTKDEDEVALNLSHGNPHDILAHFRRAAVAFSSAAEGAASSVTSSVASSVAMAAAASNLPSAPSTLGPLDIYRFPEELETSGSAGSGGATTDEEGKFACEKCDKTFTKQSSLSRHKYEHSGEYSNYLFMIFS